MIETNAMTAKQYLMQYKELNAERDSIYDEIYRLRGLSTQTTSGTISDMPKANKDSAEAAYVKVVEKIIEKEEQANRKLLEMLALEDEINGVLSAIDDLSYQRILRYRYINLYSWGKIAQKMNFSEDHVKGYLHGKALLMVNVPEKYLIKTLS